QSRLRRLEQEASQRIKSGDPADEWAEIMPWLYQRTNEELTDAHTRLLEAVGEVAAEVAKAFDEAVSSLGNPAGPVRPPSAGESFKLDQLGARPGGRLEIGM